MGLSFTRKGRPRPVAKPVLFGRSLIRPLTPPAPRGVLGTQGLERIMDVPIEEYITGEGEKSLCQPHMPTKKLEKERPT